MSISLPDDRPWPLADSPGPADEAYAVALLSAVKSIRDTLLRTGRPRRIDEYAADKLRLPGSRVTEADALTATMLADLLAAWPLLLAIAREVVVSEIEATIAEPIHAAAQDATRRLLGDQPDPDEEDILGWAFTRLARHGRIPAEIEDMEDAYRRLIEVGVPSDERAELAALTVALSRLSPDPGEVTRFATTSMWLRTRRAGPREVGMIVGMRWGDANVADLLAPIVYDEPTALVALRACLEASALAVRAYNKIRPFDFGLAMPFYIVGRRLQMVHAEAADGVLRGARDLLIFGNEDALANQDWDGPLYRWGQFLHRDVQDAVERERRAIDFCERFLAIFDRLPAAALIANPGRAIEYAKTSALHRRKGIGRGPFTVALTHDPADLKAPGDDRDEAVLALCDEDVERLPHWRLWRDREIARVSVGVLASREGVTPRTILNRLGAFRLAAREFVEAGTVYPRGEAAQAEVFLGALLADGPVPAKTVEVEIERRGLAPRTVHRAKRRLGIRSMRLTGGRGWAWTC